MFIQLKNTFWLQEDSIQAIEYVKSDLKHHYLKVYCGNLEAVTYVFHGEDAKNAFERLQVLLRPEGLKNATDTKIEDLTEEDWIEGYHNWKKSRKIADYPDEWPKDVE